MSQGELKTQILEILETKPESRNNDFYLFWTWLQDFGGLKLPALTQQQMIQLEGKLSSVSRYRRKLQGKGEFLPTRTDINGRRKGVGKLERRDDRQ